MRYRSQSPVRGRKQAHRVHRNGTISYIEQVRKEAHVLPACSASMDARSHSPFAALESAPSGSLGLVESGDGCGSVLCFDRSGRVVGYLTGAQSEQYLPAGAKVVLRSRSQEGRLSAGVAGIPPPSFQMAEASHSDHSRRCDQIGK